jgi:Arc/MetJ-type ribon-helix-helix transcriptional regulator
VREAIDVFINSKFTPENIAKITIDIPKGNVVELESLVKNGDSVSLDDAIRNAVREYTRARMKSKD